MCKIERCEKMMWRIFMKSNKRNKSQQSFEFTYSIDIYENRKCNNFSLRLKIEMIIFIISHQMYYTDFYYVSSNALY